jgi:uncharacterized protein (TIGR02145 family)
MKKFTILSFLFFLSICIYSQDYLISFAGTGGSTSVDNVKVENITQGTNLTVNGSDILNLRAVLATGINNVYNTSEKSLKVYPNPATEYTTIEFIATAPGNALIALYDQVGKTIVQTGTNLEKGTYTYQINGLSSGFYTVRVTSGTYSYTGKIISQQKGTAIARITCKSFSDGSKNELKLKSANATIQMQYNTGDRLKFTGFSGNYGTVLTDIPTGNKTITFDFKACTDGDNNNYPVVKIGTQTWMAENLKTTKYNDGNVIPNVTDGTWSTLTTPAYCWYVNDAVTYKATYGALYNWYTVNTGKLCPTGWHAPTDAEWTILNTYLGGESVAGGKLKETGTAHWNSPNTGATNETGFTALPGGYRHQDGSFYNIELGCYMWSSTEYTADMAWEQNPNNNGSNMRRSMDMKKDGFSVRCLMGSAKTDPVITWANPADIVYGTSLSATQLNATADVPGTFVYTPPIGTKLNVGANQDLRVDFTPTDAVNYNAAGKTVKINVARGIVTVTDIDGNIYHTVTIGTQTWMVENLKTTKYNDGTDIPHGTPETWPDLTTPAYCWYNDSADKYKEYGALYNWYAVNTGKLCPAGWHVPTDADWTTLVTFAGGENVAGDKLKETGSAHWIYENIGTNDFGFTALPAGSRWDYEDFCCLGYKSYWWSATQYETKPENALLRYMEGYPYIYSTYNFKYCGLSVRCIKDPN